MLVYYDEKPSYKIVFREKFDDLINTIEELYPEMNKKICIVSDSNVASLYLEELSNLLKRKFNKVISFVFPFGEKSKNLDQVQNLYETLILEHFDRKDLLIALGGGVVGDLTGFTAATYLRGIDFIQIPTSVLSQVDSSVGGKTGVDFQAYKNMVGAFYMPKLVYMNRHVLSTLPVREISAGLGEIIKYVYMVDTNILQSLKEMKDETDLLKKEFQCVIHESVAIKKDIVERDPKEKGERALLNLGHTLGHSIEKLSNFQLLHGECVALGLIGAAYISVQRGFLKKNDLEELESILTKFHLPTKIPFKNCSSKEIVQVTKSDKKMVGGQIRFIAMESLGKAVILKDVSDLELEAAATYLLQP